RFPVVAFKAGARGGGGAGGPAAWGGRGAPVAGGVAWAAFPRADGRTIEVGGGGGFARPYEPFQRGGLNLMRVRTGDGRKGTAIYEVTGSRHHHFFPDTVVPGALPG